MARTQRLYRRLPGRARKFLGITRLWMAPDHLLLVEGQGYTESYRRFYFRDIQAILVRRTDRRLVGGIPYVLIIAVFAIAWGATGSQGWRIFWDLLLALALMFFAIHIGLGPTCVCHLRTVLQEVELAPLRRLRSARGLLARIQPLIDQAQGTLPAEEILKRAGEQTEAPGPPPATAKPWPIPSGPPRIVRHDDARVHERLAVLLLANAFTTSLQISIRNPFLDAWGVVLFLAELGLALGALVRQRNTDLGPGLRRFAWTTVAYLCSLVLIMMGSTMVEVFRAILAGAVAPAPARLEKLYFLAVVGSAGLGVVGLGLARGHRRAGRPSPAPPAPTGTDS